MLDDILAAIRRYIPASIFNFFQRPYHYILSFAAAWRYGFPSKHLHVIGVTGTKGKSSTIEILNAVLEEAGFKTAISSTIRFKIGDQSTRNLFKMTMPGRFATQKLLRRAVDNHCTFMIMEMTSQGALLYRHRFIELDTLIFTNIQPEHIEAHGSYANYVRAKLSIAKNMTRSTKKVRTIITNRDDKESAGFREIKVEKQLSYSADDLKPYEIKDSGLNLTLDHRQIASDLSGLFNLYNIAAAVAAASNLDIAAGTISGAIEKFRDIPGRVERITASRHDRSTQPNIEVIVDYAHTPDSLEKFYAIFKKPRRICVLGGTGGGRDTWKRKAMGKIADAHCEEIILTDEDPYDENPLTIVEDIKAGITNKQPTVIMDRREAIRTALKRARPGDSVLITGKGTDPYIMGPNNTKTPWSDADVAREELDKLTKQTN